MINVILLERVEKLGNLGDVVSVRPGFARNFLLPQKKALRASKDNIAAFEARKAQLAAETAKRRDAAQKEAGTLNGAQVILIRQAGENGQLFGSVTAKDIAVALNEAGFKAVDRRMVRIDAPVKSIGVYDFRVQIHPEVTAVVKVNVAKSADEAEAQAGGQTADAAAGENAAA
jgi:large subunit ribosomal protein L9